MKPVAVGAFMDIITGVMLRSRNDFVVFSLLRFFCSFFLQQSFHKPFLFSHKSSLLLQVSFSLLSTGNEIQTICLSGVNLSRTFEDFYV